ncbi:hypothetical protein JL720_12673 [Aureococcus anophagefferens]|nr:hypothetical protein JL720_12673 [Aureococcus anophagefferens]
MVALQRPLLSLCLVISTPFLTALRPPLIRHRAPSTLFGALEDGDYLLQEAVKALQDTSFQEARDLVDLARQCYAEIEDDAARRAEREALCGELQTQVNAYLAKTRAARAESLAALDRRKAAPTDTAGDRILRKAVADLASQDYAAPLAPTPRRSPTAPAPRDGPRQPLRDKAEAEEEARRRGRQLVAEQKMAAAFGGGGAGDAAGDPDDEEEEDD